MRNDRLTAALADWRAWSASPPAVIGELKGGLTNQSYLLQADDAHMVLRLNADNTGELGLDRALEQQVLHRASLAGVAPALVYSNPQGGVLITEYHAGQRWKIAHNHDANKLRQFARLLKTVHQLAPVDGALDLRQRAEHYWLTLNKAGPANASLVHALRVLAPRLQEFFTRASAACTQLCVCHNDLLAANLLLTTNDHLLALDWEYAAMGDPYFDLAVVIEGQQFSDAAAQALLQYYANTPLNAGLQRLAPLRVIYCYVDVMWSLLQGHTLNRAIVERKFERLRYLLSA